MSAESWKSFSPRAMSTSTNLLVLVGIGIAGLLIFSRRQRKGVRAGNGAFIQYLELNPPPAPPPPRAPPPLAGLTFAVKDIFDIEGFITGFGNPDWLKTHGPATQTAFVVQLLVRAGAACIGKTHMDELAYSINGENKHYGTPINPASPNRVPGGSSSGSAVAVAAGLVDFALGTDTGGSVRVPAAFCGIIGFRPSHGTISTSGVIPMAQSFDTVGWFAKEPNVLRQVGYALLQQPFMEPRQPQRVIMADDCFSLSSAPPERTKAVVARCFERVLGKKTMSNMDIGPYLLSKSPSLQAFCDETASSPLVGLSKALSLIQRFEFKTNHEAWLSGVNPDLGPGILERVRAALKTTAEEIVLAMSVKAEVFAAMSELMKDDVLLVLPTTPGPPPKLNTKGKALDDYREKAFALLAIAGMSGCCQVSMPVGTFDDAPLAFSVMARQGGDRFLLDAVLALHVMVKEDLKNSALPLVNAKTNAAEAAKEKGNLAFKNKDYHKAVSHYSEAIRLDPLNSTYYNNRAVAHLSMCSFLQVEEDCSKAIDLDKKNVKAYLRRGTAREALGSYHEAHDDFRQALVLEPTNRTALDAVKRLKKVLFD
ncbi:uncharacterized protein LOC9629241 [Selaginella moellendorffii]|uniref:uncharacterized protein LOC9629241 n=1 Tax=Selaginella moellendorffii TaxID=88036 RepID=UPI000D1C7C79|nr:uncharacterized protein LOC9629241 [Selaginella moellendorffii]|eukprot:XP_024516983.1 uncharacterized protein LOC9629241 [Selaginella moellendorffii]